jgi:hypothetical protein
MARRASGVKWEIVGNCALLGYALRIILTQMPGAPGPGMLIVTSTR